MFFMMRHLAPVLVVLAALVAADGALAQSTLPGTSQFNPPPPPPPPPPRIEVPKIPQLGVVPSPNYKPTPRASHGARFNKCLDDAAAAGMTPAERGSYARGCANR